METIELHGRSYDLNVMKAIELGILTPSFVPKKVGQFFDVKSVIGTTDKYILASAAPKKVCLIGLHSGNRLNEMVEVGDVMSIQKHEWRAICGMSTVEAEYRK